MHHLDIPDLDDIRALAQERHDICVTIYLPTHSETQKTDVDRLELRALADEAEAQLDKSVADPAAVKALRENIRALREDDSFWENMATSLAVVATPRNVRTWRLPSKLVKSVMVSDRIHLRPMIRSVSFDNKAYVLTFNEGGTRLIKISREGPAVEVNVRGMPRDAQSAAGGRVRAEDGHRILMEKYARALDLSLEAFLKRRKRPLILACVSENAHHFKAVTHYQNIADEVIEGASQEKSPQDLADAARVILDAYNGRRVDDLNRAFNERRGAHTATSDLSSIARAAAQGAVELMMFDIDGALNGELDMETGAFTAAGGASAQTHDVIDDVIELALETGARLVGVRKGELPDEDSPVAALLRYAI